MLTRLKIYGAAVDFPVAKPGRIGAAAASEFPFPGAGFSVTRLPALFGFGKRALGGRAERGFCSFPVIRNLYGYLSVLPGVVCTGAAAGFEFGCCVFSHGLATSLHSH